jgi:eukaryotic-like serine/threonine-protein kinase
MQIPASMTSERWQRLQSLFDQALALDPDARATFVASACRDDAGLREQLLALLLASSDDDLFDQRVESAIVYTLQRDAELLPGQSIGRYKVIGILGRGGMGAVYLAERADKEYEQQVAIKIVCDGTLSQRIVARLRSERQILANLNHPHIARLIDGGATQDGIPYLVMEYVEGRRIDQYCKEQQLDIKQRLALFQQVCAAVQYAHQLLVIHRDIKPSNILVTASGSAKLLDFGIAKLVDPQSTNSMDLTQVHERVLTPEHASPEQMRGEPVSTASDIYALGVLLYELLTKNKPFEFAGKPFAQIEKIICEQMPSKPSEKINDRANAHMLRGDLDLIVMKALHKDSTRRYASASTLADDIENYLCNRPVVARPDSTAYRAAKFWRRNRWAVSSAVAVLVTVVAMTTFYTIRLANARNEAERQAQKSKLVADYLVDMFRSASPDVSQGKTITAVDLLHKGEETLDSNISKHPEIQAELADAMATSYYALGEAESAKRLFDKAVTLQMGQDGDDLHYAHVLASRGEVKSTLNDIAGAEVDLQEALQLQQSNPQTPPLESARTLLLLSENYSEQNSFDKALNYVDRAQSIIAAERAQDTVIGADAAVVQASLLLEKTEYVRAEHLLRDAVATRQRILGARHPDTISTQELLGIAVRRSGRFREALVILEQVLAEKRVVLGQEHPDVGAALTLIGSVETQLGHYQRADVLLRDSAKIAHDKVGPENRQYAAAIRSIANNELARGNYKHAEQLYRQAIAIQSKTLPSEDQELQRERMLLSAAIREQGRLAEADKLLEPVIRFFETYENQQVMQGSIWFEASRLRLLQNRVDDARTYLLRGEAKHKAARDELHPNHIKLLTVLAQLQLQTNEYKDAAATGKRAIELAAVSIPDASAQIATLKSIYGAALYFLGEQESGTAMVIESYRSIAKERGEGDLITKEAKQRLELISRTYAGAT